MNFKLPHTKKEEVTWTIKDFNVGAFLGKGKFGLVYESIEKNSQTKVALKILSKKVIKNYNMARQLRREIEIHSRLKHKHILNMFAYFHDESYVYVVLEYASKGNLFTKLIKGEKKFPERIAARYLFQLASAIGYMHARNVIHRDLKLENVLIDENDDLKICDFGWSVHTVENKRETICGTIDYLAPEIVDHVEYDKSVDIWCLGILFYEMVYGFPPFASKSKEETFDKIKKKVLIFRDDIQVLSDSAKDLMKKLIAFEPENRIKIEDVLQHEFFKNYVTPEGKLIE